MGQGQGSTAANSQHQTSSRTAVEQRMKGGVCISVSLSLMTSFSGEPSWLTLKRWVRR